MFFTIQCVFSHSSRLHLQEPSGCVFPILGRSLSPIILTSTGFLISSPHQLNNANAEPIAVFLRRIRRADTSSNGITVEWSKYSSMSRQNRAPGWKRFAPVLDTVSEESSDIFSRNRAGATFSSEDEIASAKLNISYMRPHLDSVADAPGKSVSGPPGDAPLSNCSARFRQN